MGLKISNFMAGGLGGSNSLTSLFDAMNKKTSNGSNISNMLQYNVVNKGAYRKALRAYYQKQSSGTGASADATAKEMTSLKAAAADLKSGANALGSASLFEKNDKGEYKISDIKSAVNDFVTYYNKMVDVAGDADSVETLRNGVWMVDNTSANKNLLAKVGITIGKDNKLSFNEASLTNASASTFKNVFSGHSSFGGRVASKASNFESIANRELGNNTYTRTGKYTEAKSASTKLDKDI